MNIRKYRQGEEQEIWLLHYQTTRQVIGRYYTQAQVERWAPDQMEPDWNERLRKKNPFVAEHSGQIVGFAELEDDGHIDRFYCHVDWQRRGVGRRLYEAVEEEARRKNLPGLFLESSIPAREFFISRGFEVVKEEANVVCDTVAPRFHMRKHLR